jgi:uncharacterized protein
MAIPVITGVQRRSTAGGLRTAASSNEFALEGYAALYNSLSKNLGQGKKNFREKIAPGTFQRSLTSGADVKALFNHAPDNILGRTKSGTLKLSDDSHGLKFRCDLNQKSQAHRDLYESVKRGDIDECSFAFTVARGGDDWMDDGCEDDDSGETCALRTLKDVDLIDVSVVTYPAYAGTEAGARAIVTRSMPDYRGADSGHAARVVRANQIARQIALTNDFRSGGPLSMVYIRLIVDHPTLGRMGTYTAVTKTEAEGLVNRGWAKYERP